ncbi:MAG TPA: hypothetical protein VGK67_24225 [Myxococcales bacterium]
MDCRRAAALVGSVLALAGCELLVRPDDVPPPQPACQPTSCEDRGKNCGSLDDGCGTSLGCGDCTSPDICGGGGVENVCAPCQPRCQGRECGSNGCGGKCGSCGAGEVCDAPAGQCVGCRTDADCATSPAGLRCEPTLRICVACLVATDCDSSGLVACDAPTHRCQASCKVDGDCASVSGAPRCDPTTRQCVACLGEADCQSPTPHCLLSSKTCVACRDQADCPAGQPLCRDHLGCVECLGDSQCPGGRCKMAAGACVGCLSDQDCSGATPRCSPDAQCVECTAGSDCPSGRCGTDGACVPPGVPGDGCALPIELDVAGGQATVLGDTTGFNDDTSTFACGGGGPDLVYKLVLSSPQDVDVILWPEVSTYRPALAVRKACADETQPNELACDKSRANGEPTAVSLTNLPAGTYYVLVDGYYTSRGAYSLTILLRTPGATTPDSCSKARALTFDSNGWAWAAGDTGGLTDDQSSSCGGGSEPDLAYKITLTEARSLDAVVSVTDVLSAYAPVLDLADGCTLPTELVCSAAGLGSGATRILVPKLAPGSYILWVDGDNGTSGQFALWVGLADPVNDTCAEVADLVFDAAGKARVTGSTLKAQNDASSPSCLGSGADVFYRLTVSAGATVTAKVTPAASSLDYDPVVYLRTACATKSSEVGCVRGAGQTLTASSLAAGTYYLVVDGYLGTAGEFTLDVTR